MRSPHRVFVISSSIGFPLRAALPKMLYMPNFYTFIDSFNEKSSLAQRGKGEEQRIALRVVGLALRQRRTSIFRFFIRSMPAISMMPRRSPLRAQVFGWQKPKAEQAAPNLICHKLAEAALDADVIDLLVPFFAAFESSPAPQGDAADRTGRAIMWTQGRGIAHL